MTLVSKLRTWSIHYPCLSNLARVQTENTYLRFTQTMNLIYTLVLLFHTNPISESLHSLFIHLLLLLFAIISTSRSLSTYFSPHSDLYNLNFSRYIDFRIDRAFHYNHLPIRHNKISITITLLMHLPSYASTFLNRITMKDHED